MPVAEPSNRCAVDILRLRHLRFRRNRAILGRDQDSRRNVDLVNP